MLDVTVTIPGILNLTIPTAAPAPGPLVDVIIGAPSGVVVNTPGATVNVG